MKGKLSYRLYNSQAIIKDAVCDRSVQVQMEGNPQLADDFLDFKKFITTEMGVVKYQLVQDLHPTNSIVDALLQRIKSLENKLDQKQTSILISQLMADHCLVNLIKTPTCFKSTHGTCIDLILTNTKL